MTNGWHREKGNLRYRKCNCEKSAPEGAKLTKPTDVVKFPFVGVRAA